MLGLNMTPEECSCVEDTVASSDGALLHVVALRSLVGIETFDLPTDRAVEDRS